MRQACCGRTGACAGSSASSRADRPVSFSLKASPRPSRAAALATRIQVAHLLRHVPWRFLAPSPRPQRLHAVSQEVLPDTESEALSSEDESEESSSAFGRLNSADPTSSSSQQSFPVDPLTSSDSAAATSMLQLPGWTAAGPNNLSSAGTARIKPLYNTERWSYHRDTSRYFRHLAGLFQSSTFRKLRLPLAFLTANAAVICVYLSMQDSSMLPSGFPMIKVRGVLTQA